MLNTIPQEILEFCTQEVGEPDSFRPASGGCINNGGTLSSKDNRVFVKWNSATRFPKMFDAEARGLNLMREAGSLKVPEVLAVHNGQEYSCIIMECIEESGRVSDFWEKFGQGLAEMHKVTQSEYGLDHSNYMGSLNQVNDNKRSVVQFFIDCRLKPQIDMAAADNKIGVDGLRLFDKLIEKLPELLIEEQPALVHGDLWSGNFMTSNQGLPVLIDPAVAFSGREVDLAMSRLFGGFDSAFYQSYHNNYPLEPGFEDRFDIYNLYPLMVHVNLFGGSYYRQVLSVLKRYT